MIATLFLRGVRRQHPIDIPRVAFRAARRRLVSDLLHGGSDLPEDLTDAILKLQLHERLADFLANRSALLTRLLRLFAQTHRALRESRQHCADILLSARDSFLIAGRHLLI